MPVRGQTALPIYMTIGARVDTRLRRRADRVIHKRPIEVNITLRDPVHVRSGESRGAHQTNVSSLVFRQDEQDVRPSFTVASQREGYQDDGKTEGT